MKKNLLFVSILISGSLICAQDVDLAGTQLNLNALTPSFSFEGKIGDKQSLTLAAGLGLAAEYTSDTYGGSGSSFYAVPVVYGSFRNYYKRKSIKKSNLRRNSGNYVGLYLHYQFEALGDQSYIAVDASGVGSNAEGSIIDNIYAIGPVWGIQRNYASGIHLGLSLGIGIVGGEYIETGVSGIGEFEFGFILFQN